jgi:threonylcarbamoyladenosine tRNA methylthiotransferase MtaB
MNSRRFHTITLGCKLNQFDSAGIEGELARRGFQAVSDPSAADVVVINTCTVTHRADADARRIIRSVRRRNPDCSLLVTGCYAELDARRLAAIGGVDRVFGNREKPKIGEILDELGLIAAGEAAGEDRGCDAAFHLPTDLHFGDLSRAFLKVQEGCRLACSYCIIPRVRGASRSVPPDDLLSAASKLVRSGYREIVLTGVNTGDYGLDLDTASNLAGLLQRLLDGCAGIRFRLNSLEPLTLSDEIIGLMATDSRLAPHLQVPLQSGSAEILRSMRRNYRLETYLDRVRRLCAAVPHAAIGADVIVGFPGESEERFRETYEFIANSPLNYLHVFSWSPRPGTPASDLPERVRPDEIRERATELRRLAERLSLRFRKRFEGRSLDGVVLKAGRDGRKRALTGNYIACDLEGWSPPPREITGLRILEVSADRTLAVADEPPSWADPAGRNGSPRAPLGDAHGDG